MLRRITLDNFMSHGHTVIDLAEGLTVLVGPNNCGKSAVVEALRAVCGEHSGDFMVRHGQKSCAVTVETDDGHVVTWRRKGGAASYVIDGREITRVGRGNLPDDLQQILRLEKVEPNQSARSFEVHFGQQKSPIFLIDSESDPAAFFSTSSDAERLLEIQKLHKQKVIAAKGEHKSLKVEVEAIDAQLATLSPLAELEPAIEAVEGEHGSLVDRSKCIAEMGLLIEKLAAQRERRARWIDNAGVLRAVEPPPEPHDTQSLELLCGQIDRIARAVVRSRSTAQCLSELQEATTPADTAGLKGCIDAIERAMRSAETARRRSAEVDELLEPPEMVDVVPLADFIARSAAADKAAARHRAAIKSIEIGLTELEQELAEWIEANPTCPVCGAPTQRQQILAGGHQHA